MCPCRVFFGAGWHLDGRQMFQIKAIYKNTLAQKIEKYESFIYNDFFFANYLTGLQFLWQKVLR